MTGRRGNPPLTAAFLLTIGLFAVFGAQLLAAGVALAVAVGPRFVPRATVDAMGQIIIGLFCLVVAYLVVVVIPGDDGMPPSARIGIVGATAAFSFLLIAATRQALRRPAGGDGATAAFLFLATLSMGEMPRGALYPAVSVTVLVLLIWACRYRDPLRPPVLEMMRSRWRPLGLMTAGAALVFSVLVVTLPLAYRAAFDLLEESLVRSRTGFGFTLSLGEMSGLDPSEEVVMRIHGVKPDYLRGAVYTRYQGGRWLGLRSPRRRPVRAAATKKSPEMTAVTQVGGRRDTYFVPLGAVDLRLPRGGVEDGSGLVRPRSGDIADTVSFRQSPDRQMTGVSEETLGVPESVAQAVRRVAGAWTGGMVDEGMILKTIEQRLQSDFDYALEVQLPPGADPLVAFLTVGRAGHCEYFASAMALIARARGIPTRVVGGYRVHEKNPLGGYYIVRERNAHAWVEAYIKGEGWRTFDPTPPMEVSPFPAKTPFAAALLDMLSVWSRRAIRAARELTVLQIVMGVSALLLFWLGIRLFRRFRRRVRHRHAPVRAYQKPLPAVEALLETLTSQGVARQRGEPLERFAERLEQGAVLGPRGTAAASLCRRYVAWRFGGEGDRARLFEDIRRWRRSFGQG